MKNPNIRQNFYQGQSVSATNLNLLQDYSDNTGGRIVSDIFGYGIISGFEVTKSKEDTFTLLISSGLAYTEQGVRLQSEQPLKIEISKSELLTSEAVITKYLVISLDYKKDVPIKDNSNTSILTEWTPTVKATLYLDMASITIDDFLIANVTFNKDGIKTINHNGKLLSDFHDLSGKVTILTTTVATNKTEINTKVNTLEDTVEDNNIAINDKVNANQVTIVNSVQSNKKEIHDKVDNLTSTSFFVGMIRDMTYPVKSTYTQYPNDTTGLFTETETPLALFGGDWDLVDTKLFNDVPTIHTNEFGVSYKYPNGYLINHVRVKLRYQYMVALSNDYARYPVKFTSFIDVPNYSPLGWSVPQGSAGDLGVTVAYNGFTSGFNRYEYTSAYTSKFSLADCLVMAKTEGYWKDPTDSITPEEEKNYVKIWKRI